MAGCACGEQVDNESQFRRCPAFSSYNARGEASDKVVSIDNYAGKVGIGHLSRPCSVSYGCHFFDELRNIANVANHFQSQWDLITVTTSLSRD